MDASQSLSIESFSHSWLVNIKPSLESFEDVDVAAFIEMDPNLPASRRFSRGCLDSNFDFPISETPPTLVHADELISNGFLIPRFGKPKKVEPCDDVAYSTPSTPAPSNDQKNTSSNNKIQYSAFRRCRRFSKRILRKSLEFVTPVFLKFGGRSSGSKTETVDWKKQEENRFTCSAPTSPRISVAYSVDNWRRSCDYESSIHEAILHCKRSIGK